MRVLNYLTVAIFGMASAAVAIPDKKDDGDHKDKHYDNDEECKCLKRKDVKELTDAYVRLIGAYNQADLKYLSEDFSDWSQSINTFIKPAPYEGATFPTKAAFNASQSNPQGPPTPIVLDASEPVVDCKKIAFIWSSTFGKQQKVQGITILTTTKASGSWQISRIDVEFNSLLWAYNLGGYYCFFGKSNGDATSCVAKTKRALTLGSK